VAEVLSFHHAQGLTPGVVGFADELRQAGHVVHVPDLFGGRTFGSIDEGMAYVPAAEFGSWPDGVPEGRSRGAGMSACSHPGA
jgi:dienelactone hydrolase